MTDWDDLRFYLAVARHGSLSAAAGRLEVNHSTISRRLAAFETQLGVQLFDRLPNGTRLTRAGREILDTAHRIEADMAAIEQRLGDRDLSPTGLLRVTAPEALVTRVLAPRVAEFNRRYPDIELGLIAADEPLSLYRREADVALRAAALPTRRQRVRALTRLPGVPLAARPSPMAGVRPIPRRYGPNVRILVLALFTCLPLHAEDNRLDQLRLG